MLHTAVDTLTAVDKTVVDRGFGASGWFGKPLLQDYDAVCLTSWTAVMCDEAFELFNLRTLARTVEGPFAANKKPTTTGSSADSYPRSLLLY